MGRREAINTKYSSIEKEYDIGYFCGLKPYKYPKPSSIDPLISWTDHKGFDLPGESKDTGNFLNSSSQDVLNTLKKGNFKILHLENLSYEDYIEQSYKCKVVFNPPGMGEYTSRMMYQCYLGNCIVMRENSYDQGYTWKNIIPEVDLRKSDWQNNLSEIIENSSKHAENCRRYFDEFWNPVSVSQYLISKIIKEKNDI